MRRELEKKSEFVSNSDDGEISSQGDQADSLGAFFERLRDVCENDSGCHGPDRSNRIQNQAERAVTVAREFKILIRHPLSWEEVRKDSSGSPSGSEHLVEFFPGEKRVIKTTIPPGFGVIPDIKQLPVYAEGKVAGDREAIEFSKELPWNI